MGDPFQVVVPQARNHGTGVQQWFAIRTVRDRGDVSMLVFTLIAAVIYIVGLIITIGVVRGVQSTK